MRDTYPCGEEAQHIHHEDHSIQAEDLKVGDFIYPWNDVMNATGNQLFEVLTIDVKAYRIFMRIQKVDRNDFIFQYVSKRGDKERVYIPH